MRALAGLQDSLYRFFDGDLWHSFKQSKVTVVAATVTAVILLASLFASLISLQNPFDPVNLELMEAFNPPVWYEDGVWGFPLGSDDQGRDLYSAILYGSRVSLLIGFASVLFAMVIGVGLGLISGYVGGAVDAVIMRVADVQISFPAILIALLIDGVMRGILPKDQHDQLAIYVLVLAIGLSQWVQFARTVRGSTMVERNKEYVQAARVIGISAPMIMLRHVLPNVMGPVLVIAEGVEEVVVWTSWSVRCF